MFEFWGVPSGSYVVQDQVAPRNQVFHGFDDLFFNRREFRAATPVEVVSGDVDDVRIVVQSGSEIAGHVIVEDPAPADFRGRVRFIGASGEEFDAAVNADHAFTPMLSQGRYEVQASAGGPLIVKSIRTEDSDVLAEGLNITGPGKTALEVVFSHDGGRIGGTVTDKDDKPAAGATVVLIPESKLRFRHDLYLHTDTDQNGHYRFETVPPGDYKLFAWEDVEPGIWFDPDFLNEVEARGQAVTVHAKGQESAKLKAIGQ